MQSNRRAEGCSRNRAREWFTASVSVVLLLSIALPVLALPTQALWPPSQSPDMRLRKSDLIGSTAHRDSYYGVWKYTGAYKYLGMTLTIWKAGGLDHHTSTIKVTLAGGLHAPGAGWGYWNDPYDYLPRDGQAVEYNPNDAIHDRDKIGDSPSPWVELPLTSVPSRWMKHGSNDAGFVALAFTTHPTCWRPGNPELRQGATYMTLSNQPPSNYYMVFIVYFESRSIDWLGRCTGGTLVDSHYIAYRLPTS